MMHYSINGGPVVTCHPFRMRLAGLWSIAERGTEVIIFGEVAEMQLAA